MPGTEYWQSDFHYFGYGYNATTKINRTKPQGLGYIYNLPGIKTVGDLIGYKIIRTIEKYNNQTNETLGGPVEIEYTIRGFFHDDQNDINSMYRLQQLNLLVRCLVRWILILLQIFTI